MGKLAVVGGTDVHREPSRHTAGPWKVVVARGNPGRPDLTYVSVQPINPDPVADRPLLMRSGEYHVCSLPPSDDFVTLERRKANARLIAVAPELLAALQAQEKAENENANCPDCEGEGDWAECGRCSELFGDAIDLRRAALAKAGEQ